MIPKPFSNIALSLSGGGYRATTFHLGAMGYLNTLEIDNENLLHRVKVISTISGGTITGVMYALVLAKGGDYQQCFTRIYRLLSQDKLVENALKKLNHPSTWKNTHKSRDVINAFSEVYNEDFFDEATFEELFDSENGHLTDAIFGSSEFTYGIQFRFQENKGNARFGNGYLNLSDETASKVRLADATAASSCFPGGFEPMIMPLDFGNGPNSEVDREWNSKKYDDVPYPNTAIMDGGIIDNQGIEGVKLAEERAENREGKPFIGTYIVSDVCSDMMKPYQVPILKHSRFKNIFTIRRINIFVALLTILLVASLVLGTNVWGTIVCSILLTLISLYVLLYVNVKRGLKKAIGGSFGSEAVPNLMTEFGVLQKTPLYILFYLIKFRVSSVIVMVSNLFLRRIRRLQLDGLYDDEDWNYRFKSNYIYTLQKKDQDLSPQLKAVIEMANDMPTTLWFTAEEKANGMLDHLIAAGQATMCFNLMTYIDRISTGKYRAKVWDTLESEEKENIGRLYENMKVDWEKFKSDPFWLLNEQKNLINS